MLSLISEPPAALYVIDGEIETRLAVPPGHVVLAFQAGQRPKLFQMATVPASIAIEGDCGRVAAMPVVVCLVPAGEADRWLALAQSEADAVHAEVIEDWVRGICPGSA
jgi:hypothetical protein